jgi:hypothetical protein
MSSGSSEKMQIHLKIDPGSVQCSVQLEGSILSTRVVRHDLKVSQFPIPMLKQTNLSFLMLKRTDLSIGSDTKQILLQIPQCGESRLLISYLERVIIHQENLLFPDDYVQLIDVRFKWKGVIVENRADRVLVNWGSSQRWHALQEIKLLVDAKINFFKIALRGKEYLLKKQVITEQLQAQSATENTYDSNIKVDKMPIKEEVNFKIGDLVKLVDLYHARGNDMGIIEFCNDGEYIVWWESDGKNQIANSFRTFCADKLTLISSE